MNCEQYESLIHLYVDHRLDKKTTDDLLSHMETCTHCRETYKEINALKDLIGGMQMKELPEGFEEELHVKLVEALVENEISWIGRLKEKIFNGRKMKMAVSLGGLALAIVLVVGSSGLLPSLKEFDSNNYGESESVRFSASSDEIEEAGGIEKSSIMPNSLATTLDEDVKDADITEKSVTTPKTQDDSFKGRLIIQTANLSLNIDNYDSSSLEIYRMVDEMGGYISDTSSYYYIYDQYDETKNRKSGYLTLRIPHQFFDQFVNQLGGYGKVTDFSSNANDITKDYRDTTAEVKNLEVREAKLREIMEKAEKIKDIIEVERELSRVRSEINRYQSALTDWEDLVTLSTITVNMTEVEQLNEFVQPVDKDMFTKAKEGFIYTINRLVDMVELFVIWLIASSPILVPVVLVGGLLSRKIYKRWKK